MIYVCIPSFDEASTVGLLLWKIRRVFGEFPREYQLLVADDGSSDHTAELLEPYAKVLPLTVVRHGTRQGYAASVEELLRLALERTDRPKRDCAVLMHADFSHGPDMIPEFVRRIESGADLVIGEATLAGEPSRGQRWLRRGAPWLLRGRLGVPGVRDIVSGFGAMRLVCLRNAIRAQAGPLLSAGDSWVANAELYARLAHHARRIEAVPVVERHDLRPRAARRTAWVAARSIWQAGRGLRVPMAPPPKPSVGTEQPAGAA
ncbi:MAG: glycosyltransferase family 2 protein [Gemmatimonadota bacterium]